jgi:prepilin-type N-terminal cleavage/methylation domain-containing protein
MRRGFTLIELMVVMAVIALLVTIVAPRYLTQTDRAREAVLRHNLKEARDAIDKFYTDYGHYPQTLKELVDARYLKMLPIAKVPQRGFVVAQGGRWVRTHNDRSHNASVHPIRPARSSTCNRQRH